MRLNNTAQSDHYNNFSRSFYDLQLHSIDVYVIYYIFFLSIETYVDSVRNYNNCR